MPARYLIGDRPGSRPRRSSRSVVHVIPFPLRDHVSRVVTFCASYRLVRWSNKGRSTSKSNEPLECIGSRPRRRFPICLPARSVLPVGNLLADRTRIAFEVRGYVRVRRWGNTGCALVHKTHLETSGVADMIKIRHTSYKSRRHRFFLRVSCWLRMVLGRRRWPPRRRLS